MILQNEKGEAIDAVGYGTPIMDPAANGQSCFEGAPAPRAPAGSSLTRTGGADTGDNSSDFTIAESTTPGIL